MMTWSRRICLARHAARRGRRVGVGDNDLVLGSAPFRVEKPDRLFDRLVRETSMVFFYDQMTPTKVGAAGWDGPVRAIGAGGTRGRSTCRCAPTR
jgi:hypothetical protein